MKLKDLKKFIDNLPEEYLQIDVYKLSENRELEPVIYLNLGDKKGRYLNKLTDETYLLIK